MDRVGGGGGGGGGGPGGAVVVLEEEGGSRKTMSCRLVGMVVVEELQVQVHQVGQVVLEGLQVLQVRNIHLVLLVQVHRWDRLVLGVRLVQVHQELVVVEEVVVEEVGHKALVQALEEAFHSTLVNNLEHILRHIHRYRKISCGLKEQTSNQFLQYKSIILQTIHKVQIKCLRRIAFLCLPHI